AQRSRSFYSGCKLIRTMIVPAAVRYQNELASAVKGAASLGCANAKAKGLLKKVSSLTEDILGGTDSLEKALGGHSAGAILKEMAKLRESVDELEAIIPENIWPLPSYAEMLFLI
nr:hypothetical protein [Candidatus Omnitrophota bacterium]